MLTTLKPNYAEIRITNVDAPLPKALPEVVGKSMHDGLLAALRCEDAELRRKASFEIWYALPDCDRIHAHKGFHVIADALGAE